MEILKLTEPPASIFKKGHLLFQEENPCDGFYYISSGVAKIFTTHPDGKEIIHSLASSGDFIGLGCFFGQGKHAYNAYAMEDMKCHYFSRQTLNDDLMSSPEIMDLVLRKIGKIVDDAYHRHTDLIRFGVRQRMARCLCDLAATFGTKCPDGIKIGLRLNREELASVVGVASETAIRFISEFKRQGLIDEKDHCLVIKDQETLEKIYEQENL